MTLRASDNPFRASRVDGLSFRAPGFAWSRLESKLVVNDGRGALRGPCGSGKSTLLRDLASRLGDRGLEVRHLRPDLDDRAHARRQVRALSTAVAADTALLLDGADRVGAWAWRRFLRASRGAAVIVITTHREGRLPTLHRCTPSADLLAELVAELVGQERLEKPSLERLFTRHGGNLRLALRELYDESARRALAVTGRTNF